MERAAILAEGPTLELEGAFLDGEAPAEISFPANQDASASPGRETLEGVQRLHILSVLKTTGGVVEGAEGAATIHELHPRLLIAIVTDLTTTLDSPKPTFGFQKPRHVVAAGATRIGGDWPLRYLVGFALG